MNERYQLQQPGPRPPYRQSLPSDLPPDQVVHVWRGGRVIPLFGSACALVVLAFLVWEAIHGTNLGVPNMVIMFVLFALGTVLAFRRKVTLTTHHLIVRKLFRTRVLPLHEIVHTFEGSRYSGVGFGRQQLLMDFLRLFLPKPVTIKLQDNRTCETRSFGWKPMEAQVTIAKAAKAAGSPIEI